MVLREALEINIKPKPTIFTSTSHKEGGTIRKQRGISEGSPWLNMKTSGITLKTIWFWDAFDGLVVFFFGI